jgi:hypothetical protein
MIEVFLQRKFLTMLRKKRQNLFLKLSSENPTDKKTWTWDEIRKLKPSEYDKFEKEIDMANREGRIK